MWPRLNIPCMVMQLLRLVPDWIFETCVKCSRYLAQVSPAWPGTIIQKHPSNALWSQNESNKIKESNLMVAWLKHKVAAAIFFNESDVNLRKWVFMSIMISHFFIICMSLMTGKDNLCMVEVLPPLIYLDLVTPFEFFHSHMYILCASIL